MLGVHDMELLVFQLALEDGYLDAGALTDVDGSFARVACHTTFQDPASEVPNGTCAYVAVCNEQILLFESTLLLVARVNVELRLDCEDSLAHD